MVDRHKNKKDVEEEEISWGTDKDKEKKWEEINIQNLYQHFEYLLWGVYVSFEWKFINKVSEYV